MAGPSARRGVPKTQVRWLCTNSRRSEGSMSRSVGQVNGSVARGRSCMVEVPWWRWLRGSAFRAEQEEADGVGVGFDDGIAGGIEPAQAAALRREDEHRRAGAGEDVLQVRRVDGR